MNAPESAVFIKVIAATAAFLFMISCAPRVVSPPGPPLDPQEIDGIVAAITAQNTALRTLFSSGQVSVKTQQGELDARVLMIVSWEPKRIKIEITHPWGRPIAHLLIKDSDLRLLFFSDRCLYQGRLGDPRLSIHLGVPFSEEMLWSIVRAYPVLPRYHRAVSRKGHRITFLTKSGEEKAVLQMSPRDRRPKSLSFPRLHTGITFSDFQKQEKRAFARDVQVSYKSENRLTFALDTMVFNESIPPKVFTLNVPRDFTIRTLSEER